MKTTPALESVSIESALDNALTAISRTLYGVQGVPKTPSGQLEYAHRQMIAMQYPHLVAALLHLQSERVGRREVKK